MVGYSSVPSYLGMASLDEGEMVEYSLVTSSLSMTSLNGRLGGVGVLALELLDVHLLQRHQSQ